METQIETQIEKQTESEEPIFRPAYVTVGLRKCAESQIVVGADSYTKNIAFKVAGVTLVKHAP
jgi:hypothetical protein